MVLVLVSCGERQSTPRVTDLEPGVLLSGPGIRITRAEFEPLDAWIREHDPSLGRKYRAREILDQCLLPIALARRDHAAERARLREAADALRDGCDNSLELRRRGDLAGGGETAEPLPANQLPMTIRDFAFRPENLGAVSPVTETPDGFMLLAPLEIVPGLTSATDAVHAYVIRFDMTSAPADWLERARRSLQGVPLQVHPDLEGALPQWL